MRRLTVLLVTAILLFGVATQAFGTTWFLFRAHSLQCDFDEQVKTRIVAQGDHKHNRVDIGVYVVDYPDPWNWHTSYKPWGFAEMEYRLYNESGYPYNGSQSYGYCTPA